jgi:hypothetical protein
MNRVIANPALLQLRREFLGNALTTQVRADFVDKRRDLLKPANP